MPDRLDACPRYHIACRCTLAFHGLKYYFALTYRNNGSEVTMEHIIFLTGHGVAVGL
jgi:hypothetical protein